MRIVVHLDLHRWRKSACTEQRTENEVDISTLWSPVILNATDILEIDLVSVTTATVLTLQLFVIAL
jgi:hypothetical protein